MVESLIYGSSNFRVLTVPETSLSNRRPKSLKAQPERLPSEEENHHEYQNQEQNTYSHRNTLHRCKVPQYAFSGKLSGTGTRHSLQ